MLSLKIFHFEIENSIFPLMLCLWQFHVNPSYSNIKNMYFYIFFCLLQSFFHTQFYIHLCCLSPPTIFFPMKSISFCCAVHWFTTELYLHHVLGSPESMNLSPSSFVYSFGLFPCGCTRSALFCYHGYVVHLTILGARITFLFFFFKTDSATYRLLFPYVFRLSYQSPKKEFCQNFY